jgi:hypothetical protein
MALALARTRLITRPRGPFAFPGTAPGFDMTHPAAKTNGTARTYSVIARSGNFINLMNGKQATLSGTPTADTLSGIGPCTGVTGTQSVIYADQSNAVDAAVTFAAILQLNSVPAVTTVYLNNGSNNEGGKMAIGHSGAAVLQLIAWGGTTVASTLTISASIPYFIAVTNNAASSYFVMRRLDNGVLRTDTQTKAIAAAGPPTLNSFEMGNAGTTRPMTGRMACGMYTPASLTLAELVQWSADPWSFWYPNR